MAFIEILLLGFIFLALVACGVLYGLIFLNVNIFEWFKDTAKQAGFATKDEFWQVYDISPTKVVIARVPETGYEFQVYKFAYAWNGKVALLGFNDEILYMANSKKEIQPDDELAILKGEDVYVLNIVTHGYKVQQHDRMVNANIQNSLLRHQVAESNKLLQEQLISMGSTLREGRKAISWSASTQQPMNFMRRPPWMGGSMEGENEEML